MAGAVLEAVGLGVFMTTGLIYFTQMVGLPAVQVGAAMTVAGVVGLVLGTPLGSLVDRIGVRPMIVVGLLGQAAGTILMTAVKDIWIYAVVVLVVTLSQRLAYAARSVMISEVFKSDRVTGKAKIRALQNVGLSVGALAGVAVLHFNSAAGFRTGLVLNGSLFAVSALLALRVPKVQAAGVGSRPGQARVLLAVHRDRRFMAVGLLNGLTSVHYGIFEVALPLWIVSHTDAPRWAIGASFILATVMVVIFQVRVSKRADGIRGASKVLKVAALLFLVATAAYAGAGQVPGQVALVVILLGTAVYVFGEMGQAAAAWSISFELSPDERMGEYQAAFGAMQNGGMMLAPLLVTSLIVQGGGWGLVAIGAMVALAGLLTSLTAERVASARARDGEVVRVGG